MDAPRSPTPTTIPCAPEVDLVLTSTQKTPKTENLQALLKSYFRSSANNIEDFLDKKNPIYGNPQLGTVLYELTLPLAGNKTLLVKKISADTKDGHPKTPPGLLKRHPIRRPTENDIKKSAHFNMMFGLSPIAKQ